MPRSRNRLSKAGAQDVLAIMRDAVAQVGAGDAGQRARDAWAYLLGAVKFYAQEEAADLAPHRAFRGATDAG